VTYEFDRSQPTASMSVRDVKTLTSVAHTSTGEVVGDTVGETVGVEVVGDAVGETVGVEVVGDAVGEAPSAAPKRPSDATAATCAEIAPSVSTPLHGTAGRPQRGDETGAGRDTSARPPRTSHRATRLGKRGAPPAKPVPRPNWAPGLGHGVAQVRVHHGAEPATHHGGRHPSPRRRHP
jgi:hypothetical protein